MYDRPRVNVKVDRGSTFAFTRDLEPCIASTLFTRAKFAYGRTSKLRDSGNQPLGLSKYVYYHNETTCYFPSYIQLKAGQCNSVSFHQKHRTRHFLREETWEFCKARNRVVAPCCSECLDPGKAMPTVWGIYGRSPRALRIYFQQTSSTKHLASLLLIGQKRFSGQSEASNCKPVGMGR